MIVKSQIQRIHSLLPVDVKNNKEVKEQLISQFTGSNELTSTKDLSFTQANELIIKLKGTPIRYDNWAFFNYKNSQHRYILSLLLQLEWSNYSTSHKRYFADLYRFSEWLKSNKSPVRKKLKKMSAKELTKIISALESMLSKKLN